MADGFVRVSPQLLKVFDAVRSSGRPVTVPEIVARTGVGARCARVHALTLFNLGVFDRSEVSPAFRYWMAPTAAPACVAALTQLEEARTAFHEREPAGCAA